MNEFLKVTFGDDHEVLRYKNRVMVLETLYTPLKHYTVIQSMRTITKHLKTYMKEKKMHKSVVVIQNNARCYLKRKRYLQMRNAMNLTAKHFEEYSLRQNLKVLENAYFDIASRMYALAIRRRFLKAKHACVVIQKTFRCMKGIKLKKYTNMLAKLRKMEEEKKASDILTKKLQTQITNMRRINKRRKQSV